MKNLFAICAVLALATSAFAQEANMKTASVYAYPGVPANGTDELNTVTIGGTPTAGSFTITIAGGRTTRAIAWSATNATLLANVDAALEDLAVIGIGGVTTADSTLSSGIGAFTITLAGKNARQDFAAMSVTSSLTGTSPTLAIANTTPGVAATFAKANPGQLVQDSTNGELYQNLSTTAGSPNWQLFRGWKTGSGGAVTQITSRATGVTLNKRVGKITTTADSLAGVTPAVFTVTNSTVAATDNIIVTKVSGDVDTQVSVNSVGAGSFTVLLWNTHASGADTTALAFNFEVRRGAID